MQASSQDELVGRELGSYRVQEKIAEGGMGSLYAGIHRFTRLGVVIKFLRPDLVANRKIAKRFLKEAQAAALIQHPNIVAVHDLGAQDGLVYQVLERLDGSDLSHHFRKGGTFTVQEAVCTLEPIMDAVAKAHDSGIVHRDLKPGNIFLARDERLGIKPMLLDFGIAKSLGDDGEMTKPGEVLGTPTYMAPEQLRHSMDAGPAVDVWAMGVIFYRLVSGKKPHDVPPKASPMERAQILLSPPKPLREACPGLPEGIYEWLDRAMSIDPTSRPSMAELADGLSSAAYPEGLSLDEAIQCLCHRVERTGITRVSLPARSRRSGAQFTAVTAPRSRRARRPSQLPIEPTMGRPISPGAAAVAGATPPTIEEEATQEDSFPAHTPLAVQAELGAPAASPWQRRAPLLGAVAMALLGLFIGTGLILMALRGRPEAESVQPAAPSAGEQVDEVGLEIQGSELPEPENQASGAAEDQPESDIEEREGSEGAEVATVADGEEEAGEEEEENRRERRRRAHSGHHRRSTSHGSSSNERSGVEEGASPDNGDRGDDFFIVE